MGVLPEREVVQLSFDMNVMWCKLNCIWIPHRRNTLRQRDGGEKDLFFFFLIFIFFFSKHFIFLGAVLGSQQN